MERLERFYKIHQLLTDRNAVPFKVLMERLGVSRASVKRDLEYMRSRFHAPIEYDREANGYRFGKPRTGPTYELPGLWFSAEEAYALLDFGRVRRAPGNAEVALLGRMPSSARTAPLLALSQRANASR